MLAGKWTFRSFGNQAVLIDGDPAAALVLLAEEGVLDLEAEGDHRFHGGIGIGPGRALTVGGTVEPGIADGPRCFSMLGEGVGGTATEGWRYRYRGIVGPLLPGGAEPLPLLMGTVLRMRGGEEADALSFIAVRQPPPPPRARRVFTLMADI